MNRFVVGASAPKLGFRIAIAEEAFSNAVTARAREHSLLREKQAKSALKCALQIALVLALVLFSQAQANPLDVPSRVARLIVSPAGPYTTIQAALADAHAGDTIEVRRGVYPGPLIVDTAVSLEGVGWPVIDNGGSGTVVTLAAPGITFRGFELRGSGTEPDRDHSGITIVAPRVVAENNRLTDVLFGIFVARAADSIVRGNDITSKPEYEVGCKGDGIRLWYSPRVIVENNYIHDSRDVVIWYSSDVKIHENLIERGRYGVHLMYCDGAEIERNRLLDNSVGIYTMYSNDIALRENLIRGQRGPSGYALGFKDADNIEVVRNVLVDNRAGIFMDGTPFSPQGFGRVRENILAFNDVGVIMQPAVRGNALENNTFWENVEQVAVQGGGTLGTNTWRGNYWSDYIGFDANGDGQGAVPYHAERFFEGLADREPMLRALIYSPAAQAIEFAASALPIVRPQPKLTDPAPRTQPLSLPAFAASPQGRAGDMTRAAMVLLGLSGVFGALAWRKGNAMSDSNFGVRRLPISHALDDRSRRTPDHPRSISVRVNAVSKRYGKVKALDAVSFEAHAGEALALWGPNGAGKTTLLKALLGLIDFQGQIQIEGHDARRAGKLARRSIGYVPQEAAFYDLSVRATLEFYARLKKVDGARAAALLERVGLGDHARKPVPALSGGMKQRLALAIALLADPPVLLLDEPTANLDTQARRDYLALLAMLHHEGKTVIFASHRVEEVEALADRVLVIKDGRLAETLSPEGLRARWTPEVEMTVGVADAQRAQALAGLEKEGLNARFNGRGTVVVQVRAEQKMQPLQALSAQGIAVLDFQVEGLSPWN